MLLPLEMESSYGRVYLYPQRTLAAGSRQGTGVSPPVICMGGMMNAAIVEIMKETGHTLPDGITYEQGDEMSGASD